MIDKSALTALEVVWVGAMGLVDASSVVYKNMPYYGPQYKAPKGSQRYADEVEENHTDDAAYYFAVNSHVKTKISRVFSEGVSFDAEAFAELFF